MEQFGEGWCECDGSVVVQRFCSPFVQKNCDAVSPEFWRLLLLDEFVVEVGENNRQPAELRQGGVRDSIDPGSAP